MRGGGGWEIVGGRHCAAGGLVRGGPEYSGSGALGCGGGPVGVASAAGRCQYASSWSGAPVGELTFTDGTAVGGGRPQGSGHTLLVVDILDEPERDNDADREVDFEVDEPVVLPDQTRDDTAHGWGEQMSNNDDRLFEDRPPHWG